MGKLNSIGMAAMEAERKAKKQSMDALTSIPFDLKKVEHIQALHQYLAKFELSVNQMYIYQAMSTGLTAWCGSWVVGFFLPIPDFARYFLTVGLYLGVGGCLLESFSLTDFYEQLNEMKLIYNWCLKNGLSNYLCIIDNNEKLDYPDIQRMIKLMAPLCPKEDMIVWPVENNTDRKININ